VKVLLEVENIEGEDLKRVLDGLDLEPPSDGAAEDATPEPEEPKVESPDAPQPQIGKPGLAWGSQANISLGGDDPTTTT
jgi:hypothetical protein